MSYPFWFIPTFVFIFGAVFGSFLNVCVHRFPLHDRFADQMRSLWGRSACPRCKSEILAHDNLPILGWLMLGGRCRSCKLKISARYPIIELLNGLLFLLVYWLELPHGLDTQFNQQCCFNGIDAFGQTVHQGPQMVSYIGAYDAPVWMHLRYLFHMVLIECLVVATFIDLEHRIIPDGCTVPAMIFAVLASTIFGQLFLAPVWWVEDAWNRTIADMLPTWMQPMMFDFNEAVFASQHPHLHGFLVSICGLLVGGGIVWAVRILGFAALRQEAMGFGDVVLMAAIGSFIGWQPVVVVFFLAPMVAMVVVALSFVFRRSREIPYGPYLSLATIILLLGWQSIWPLARRFFDMGASLFLIAIVMAVLLFLSLLLTQLVKRMLGIPLYRDTYEWVEEWTSADQLHYQAGNKYDSADQLSTEGWQGTGSGRGISHNEVWRSGE